MTRSSRSVFFLFSFFFFLSLKASVLDADVEKLDRWPAGRWWFRAEKDRGSVETQIVSWKEDVATWPILLVRVPGPFGLKDLLTLGCPVPARNRTG